MSAAPTAPSRTPFTQAKQPAPTMAFTATKPAIEPPRILLNAVEGFGKTTFAAHAPGVVFIQIKGETGYETLYNAGRVPLVPHLRVETWEELIAAIQAVPAGSKWVAIDTISGAERLCADYVCRTQFNNDWTDKGYNSFGKGAARTAAELPIILTYLDRLRAKGTGIIGLCHVRVKTHKNPIGPDYDKYAADMDEKSAGVVQKWFDAILFGTFATVVEGGSTGDKGKKGKGIGGTERIIYTEQCDAWVAKNRYGMPSEIEIKCGPEQVWADVFAHIQKEN